MGPVTDLPMRWRFWIPVWLLVVIVVAASMWLTRPVEASGGGDVAECSEWGETGTWALTKCEDDDGLVCVSSSSGLLFCKFD